MKKNSQKRLRLDIAGVVQGVGFRPFVYQLSLKHSLSGYVLNSGEGVVIEVEGLNSSIESFLEELKEKHPPLARIDRIELQTLELQNTQEFSILRSNNTDVTTMLSPDISMCQDCRDEMNDPANRRYKYPFINCTNCGPRYSIVKELPYDRKNTSMQEFEMCEECQKEYSEPTDRRFHAQPSSCFDCGPTLNFSIEEFAGYINDGKILALKGLGGFHIVCDATNDQAVQELRKHKNRPTKPFAVMFKDIEEIKKAAYLSEKDEELILSKERPIVIVRKKENSFLSSLIAPNIDRVGVFLPYTPLHELILEKLEHPIVATSANLGDEPIITDEEELHKKLPFLEHTLSHNREIVNACDDSVVCSVAEKQIVLRNARGFTPQSFHQKHTSTKKILALGAHQKSTITLAFENHMILSPHIGDLNSLEAFEYFLRTLDTFKRLYNFEPDIIVCDKHPHYETSKWAKSYIAEHKDAELLEVQHHYAHALACMAEYNLEDEALAFCFDGTGYGDDATLWGGEVLRVSSSEYKRLYHLQQFSLLGGEKAVKEPRRVALSLLFESFTKEEILEMEHELVNSFSKEEIDNYHLMYTKQLNSPKSSSIGRLFDAVYAFGGNLNNLSYEGESGLIVEKCAQEHKSDASYPYRINNEIIEFKEMIVEILNEKEKALIASKFINTLKNIMVELALKHPELPVILSGGVFQNKTLLEKTIAAFEKNGIDYYFQSKTAINDGGISLGQAYYALHMKKEK
ncbi:carbamoyltransferase HypF [Sulfurimonas microaerophilic]|uniref:carbamoyltransferase HypF n=1 Tax=Sulfurimonas microaerophilic TaxID=3058392 RepID=UPI002714F7DB|nr:carbamoyltransferase HypF [Sulfurimonas sp. hsl 1-7]